MLHRQSRLHQSLDHADPVGLHPPAKSAKETLKDGACIACIGEAAKVLEPTEAAGTEGRRTSAAERIEAWLPVGGAVLIVCGALLVIAEQVVRVLNLDKAFLCALFLVGVRVKLLASS